MPLPCTGSDLPDIPSIDCPPNVTRLDDCCKLVAIEDEILLYEKQSDRPYYWIVLQADEMPLSVCNLEAYANSVAKNDEWMGRRCDYMAMGWAGGECCLLAIELRDRLTSETQVANKFEQIEQSIEQIMARIDTQIIGSPLFEQACASPDDYKVAGIVIAPAGIRKKSRSERIHIIRTDTYSAAVAVMPPDRIHDCRLQWSDLMEMVGAKRSY